ncbi:MAG: hypothetical protein IJC84_06880 [Clostridia bacterium]|nr:hypothetical protein [Clostridia bacterium]
MRRIVSITILLVCLFMSMVSCENSTQSSCTTGESFAEQTMQTVSAPIRYYSLADFEPLIAQKSTVEEVLDQLGVPLFGGGSGIGVRFEYASVNGGFIHLQFLYDEEVEGYAMGASEVWAKASFKQKDALHCFVLNENTPIERSVSFSKAREVVSVNGIFPVEGIQRDESIKGLSVEEMTAQLGKFHFAEENAFCYVTKDAYLLKFMVSAAGKITEVVYVDIIEQSGDGSVS